MRALVILCLLAGVARADDEPTLRADAVARHAAAQKSNRDADFQLAADAYATYLAAFPATPQAAELRFYRAQILIHHLHRPVDGADEMMIVARTTPLPAQKLVEDGLLEAIDVYFTAAEDTKLVAAADRYAELTMGGPHIVGIMFKLARRAHDRKAYEEAILKFQAIVTKYPNDPFAGPAGDLLLDSLAQLRDLPRLEATARALKSSPAYQAREAQLRLERLVVQAMRLRADDFARAKDWKHGAEVYLQIASEFPKSERIDETLYNAGVMLDQGGDFDGAVVALRKVADTAPGTRIASRALIRAGAIDEVLRPERAAEEFIRASAIGCGPDLDCRDGADARYNAAIMFAAIGDTPKALAAFATYIKDFPKGSDLGNARLQLGLLTAQTGNVARAEKVLEDYTTTRPRDPLGWLELGKLASKLGHRDPAEHAFEVAYNVAMASASKRLAAEARFEIAELHRHELENHKLPTIAQLDAVRRSYDRVVELDDPFWLVAARDRMAHIDEVSATATGAAARDHAIAAYREALAKADELGVVGDYVHDARAQLERLQPADFKPGHEAREGLRDHSFWPALIDHR